MDPNNDENLLPAAAAAAEEQHEEQTEPQQEHPTPSKKKSSGSTKKKQQQAQPQQDWSSLGDEPGTTTTTTTKMSKKKQAQAAAAAAEAEAASLAAGELLPYPSAQVDAILQKSLPEGVTVSREARIALHRAATITTLMLSTLAEAERTGGIGMVVPAAPTSSTAASAAKSNTNSNNQAAQGFFSGAKTKKAGAPKKPQVRVTLTAGDVETAVVAAGFGHKMNDIVASRKRLR